MPRITRAQAMDILSSMATIAGYHAVLLAASALPKIFPLLVTAAGTVSPARVLVIGAGVAGLQAIATARRLGGVVEAYDTRPVVKEQVQSLGAKFVELAARDQGRAGRRRLRARAERGVLRAPARAARGAGARERRGDHDGAGAGRARAAADRRGGRARHAAGLGDRRPRGRGRRQLRAHARRRGRARARRHDPRPPEPAERARPAREPALLAQSPELPGAPRARGQARARSRATR